MNFIKAFIKNEYLRLQVFEIEIIKHIREIAQQIIAKTEENNDNQ